MSHAESSLRLLDYLAHIVEAVERIHGYVQDMDEVAFAADQRTQDAVIRNFEIIGEACNNVAKNSRPMPNPILRFPGGLLTTCVMC